MSILKRKSHAIRVAIADNHAAAKALPKMSQRRAALFLRSHDIIDVASANSEVAETPVISHEIHDGSALSQSRVPAFFFPPRPKPTGNYDLSLKRQSAMRKTELSMLEEAQAQVIPSAVKTRFFRSSPAYETAIVEKNSSSLKTESAELSEFTEKPGRRCKSRKKWLLIAAAALLCGGYVGVAATHTDVVAKGTTVAGVDIGSLSPQEAAAKLTTQLEPRTSQKFTVKIVNTTNADTEISVDPCNYNLAFDAKATIDSLTGFSLAPSSVFAHLFGGSAQPAQVTYDEMKMAAELQEIQSQVKGGYKNATIVFDGTQPQLVPSEDGLGIDTSDAIVALTQDVLKGAPLSLKVSQSAPIISDEEAERAIEDYAKPLVKAPFTVQFSNRDYELAAQDLAHAASFVAVNDDLRLALDTDELAEIIEKTEPEGVVFGKDAQIVIVDHKRVEIIPSTDGVGIDREKLENDILSGFDGDRHIVAELGVAPARFSTEDAEKMGVTEVVSEIDTPFPADYYRTLNLIRGGELTSGKLIRPGETFVLSEALSPVTASNGFYSSGMIIGGVHKNGMGGGLSQVTTNTFNLGYLAGYTDVEHHPHSYYFTRYPMGREATLAIGSFDMRWTNNTPYGAIIDTWVEDGYLHSRLWSTKYWDVEATISEPRNVRGVGWNTSTAPDCVPSYPGQNGFTVTISRTVRHGDEVWTETADVTYRPDHGLRCVKPKPKPSDAPSSDADSSSSGE